MADSIKGFAEGGKAFGDRGEQFCAPGASEDHNEDSGKDNVGHNLVDFQRCHDLTGKTFTASAIVVGHVRDRVEEHPDEQEGSEDAYTSCRQDPDRVIATAEVVQVCDMCSFDEEELSGESASEEEADAEINCCPTEATSMYTDTRDGNGCDEESDRDNVAGADEETYPGDMTDALPADFFDSAPWYNFRDWYYAGAWRYLQKR